MKDKLKTHIGAAQSWLSDAAGAIEREEKTRGALDIMLAEAEIARVKEINSGKKWYDQPQKLLPFAAVFIVALLAAGFYKNFFVPSAGSVTATAATTINKPVSPQKPTITKPQIAKPTVKKPLDEAKKTDDGQNAKHTTKEQTNKAGENTKAAPPKISPPDLSPKKNLPIEPPQFNRAVQPNGSDLKSASTPSVPDKNLQKLMLDAGRVLRKTN